jgi:hypothetical protein
MSQKSNKRVPSGELQYHKFLNTYSGGELLKKHSLDEEGIWQIYGEDPNCDMGGAHHEPLLVTVEGKLDDVIQHAVELPRFWSWGSGGRIRKLDNIIKVDKDTSYRRKLLSDKKKALLEQLKEIDDELNDFGGDAYV